MKLVDEISLKVKAELSANIASTFTGVVGPVLVQPNDTLERNKLVLISLDLINLVFTNQSLTCYNLHVRFFG